MNEISIRRRTQAEQLRYLAAKLLDESTSPVAVSFALDVMADQDEQNNPTGADVNGERWYGHPVTLHDHIRIAMLHEATFSDTTPENGGLYVQLGPGKKLISSISPAVGVNISWDNLDYPAWDGNRDALPYKSDEISGIVSYHTLDHLSNPIHALAEIQRVLKPGAWFVNVVPHYDSELWHSDLTHKSQFGTETWRSVFSERHYSHDAVFGNTEWRLKVEFNMIMGFTERNIVLVTKLVKTVE